MRVNRDRRQVAEHRNLYMAALYCPPYTPTIQYNTKDVANGNSDRGIQIPVHFLRPRLQLDMYLHHQRAFSSHTAQVRVACPHTHVSC